MKKYRIHIAAFLILTLLLTGCGKVTETEEAIASIGTVTLDSETAIIYAEQLYASLSENQQAKVEGADILTAAREEYDRKINMIAEAEAAIAAIGTVTADSGDLIQKAINLHHALISEKLDSEISHLLPILEQAKESYELAQIQAVYDEAVAVYETEDYEEAGNLFMEFIDEYPDSELVPAAKEKTVSCCVHLIKELLDEGELEKALMVTEYLPEYFGGDTFSTEFINLRTQIYDQLAEIRPETGYFVADHLDSGYPEFTIENQSEYDVCLKLEDIEDPEKYIMFYVRSDESFTVNMEDGTYTLKYISGRYWFSDEELFGQGTAYYLSEGTCEMETVYYSGSTQYSVVTYIINPSSGDGNVGSEDIDPEDF